MISQFAQEQPIVPMTMHQDHHHQVQHGFDQTPIHTFMQFFQKWSQKLPAAPFHLLPLLLFLRFACTLLHEQTS
jgi:hypothetical protein